jgi:glucokinase
MILAGDVGGTKTLLGLFERGTGRPEPRAVHIYHTSTFSSFTAILDAFAKDAPPFTLAAAAIGVAGPVIGDTARLTNIPWDISAADITARFGTTRVQLLNDLEAMAWSVEVLTPDEVELLQEGTRRDDGNAVVIAAGTGLGQAYLHRVDGHLRPVASEGGHADFAARTDREMEFTRMLRDRDGRAEVEQVLSGPGLVNLYRFTHRGGECPVVAEPELADGPARISQSAMSGRCQFCADALAMFVSAYGAEAGNLALRGVATSGVYVGGGIAPKILPAIRRGGFMNAFRDKAPMAQLVERVPVKIILNAEAGLLGAAVHGSALASA